VEGERSLKPEVEQALFRVAQEALANAAKHSQARRVEVTLSYSEDTVLLEVVDDGQGFVSPPPADRGMGLRSMGERMETLGGELAVESVPGRGTRVVARCEIAPVSEGVNRV